MVKDIVADDDQQHFLHVIHDVHVPSASIDHLLQTRLVGPGVKPPQVQFIVYFVGVLVALFECTMVCAYKHHP